MPTDSLTRRARLSALSLLSAAALLPGCLDLETVDDTGAVDEEVIGGYFASPEATGSVAILKSGQVNCSGTLITNRWVLTAKHCLAPLGSPDLLMDSAILSVRFGTEIRQIAELVVAPDDLDVGMMRLTTPMPVDGHTAGFLHAIYPGTPDSMDGKVVQCFGYGFNSTAGGGSGAGTLRSAMLRASKADGVHYDLEPNTIGQIITRGDSGGACFDAQNALTGVHSTDTHIGSIILSGKDVGVGAFRVWMNQTIYRNATDLDRDQRTDLVWRDLTTGDVQVDRLHGTVFGGAPMSIFPGMPLDWQLVGTGDFDNDDDRDMLWRNLFSGDPWILEMDGLEAIDWHPLPPVPVDTVAAGIADFDMDGDDDIIWHDPFTAEVSIWFLQGSIQVAEQTIPFLVGWTIAAVADLDGDHAAEIVFHDPASGMLWRWLWNGTEVEAGDVSNVTPTGWIPQGTGDFNRDGRQDLVFRDAATGATFEWWMDGGTLLGQQQPPFRGFEWELVRVGDVDGDGDADLVWRDLFGGLVDVWILDHGLPVLQGGPGVRPLSWTRPQL